MGGNNIKKIIYKKYVTCEKCKKKIYIYRGGYNYYAPAPCAPSPWRHPIKRPRKGPQSDTFSAALTASQWTSIRPSSKALRRSATARGTGLRPWIQLWTVRGVTEQIMAKSTCNRLWRSMMVWRSGGFIAAPSPSGRPRRIRQSLQLPATSAWTGGRHQSRHGSLAGATSAPADTAR